MLKIFGRAVHLSAPRAAQAAAPASAIAALCMMAVLVPAISHAADKTKITASAEVRSQIADEFSSVDRGARLQKLQATEKELEQRKAALEQGKVSPRGRAEYRRIELTLRKLEREIDREKIRSGEPRGKVARERALEERQERIDERNARAARTPAGNVSRGGIALPINPDNQKPAGKPVVINPDNQKSAAPKPVIINPDNAGVNRLTGSGTPINPDSRPPAGVRPTNSGAGTTAGGPAPMPPRPEPWRGRVN